MTPKEMLRHQLMNLKLPTYYQDLWFDPEFSGRGKTMQESMETHDSHEWTFDFAFPSVRLAVQLPELTDSVMLKVHCATDLGWDVYFCNESLIKSGDAAAMIEKLVNQLCSKMEPTGE